MRYILVIEDDERIQKELFDTLKSIDPQLQIRYFVNLDGFHIWLKEALNSGVASLAAAGKFFNQDPLLSTPPSPQADDTLRLIIAKNEFLGVQNMALIRRAQEFFIRKKLCLPSEPTSLVLTAFDSPQFDILLAEERIINNVIFKPFDKLILKQHLEFAIGGRHPLDGSTISTIQLNDTVEMLKRTHFESLNELGFSTLNNHTIELGAMTKYYSDYFVTENKRSIFAKCTNCKQLGPDKFLCDFDFFAADNEQLVHIKKIILQNKQHQEHELLAKPGGRNRIILLDDDEKALESLASLLSEKFSQIEIFKYTSSAQLISDLADKDTIHRQKLPANIDALFMSQSFLLNTQENIHEGIAKAVLAHALKNGDSSKKLLPFYLLSKKRLSPEQSKEFSLLFSEIFYYPYDRSYVPKKLVRLLPTLFPKESLSIVTAIDQSTLKIANTVEINQISEAGLVMKYYRSIGLGAFREFILVRPNDQESPEITGTCNFAEEVKGDTKKVFDNHFVFFGMRDHFLKHIRLWLRETYVKNKKDDA